MTCVYKEYDMKIKMLAIQAMTTAKNKVFIGKSKTKCLKIYLAEAFQIYSIISA